MGVRHHALPNLRLLELHRAREHSAHRVSEQTDRLTTRLARVERSRDRVCESPRFVFYRTAPIEREFDDLVRLRQVLAEVVIAHSNGSVGLDSVVLARVVELLQAVDQ